MSQMPGLAAKRSDPNAVDQQHCWASSLVGKREIPERPCHPGPGSERRRGKDAFEGDIPQTCCESKPPVFRRAGYEKCTANPGGRSNSNVSVCSAIGYRSKSRTVRVGELTKVSASLIVSSSPAPRIRPVNHLHSTCGFAQGLVMAEGITENVGCFVPLKRFSQDIEPAGIQHFGPEEPTIT